MTPDQERYAEALAIERMHGADAPRWIVERIGSLALAGDEAGVLRFIESARPLDELMRAPEV
ncbi:hypothetical protein EJC47_15775 [Sphingomonas sp. TF3]|uniref:DUF6961 family protein n=1 Tax=Sphingomonas sp. TF3 TaxID=2495580 RepID=UPI000F895B85|nr:hypothetical protein [Sphingomonas sp. TF3]RUN75488.1 hypothetical protein EJC47_15775 [Sphingomonas sp. TF3]